MSSSHVKLARWSAGHHGVLTTDRLRATGLTTERVRQLCTNGTLRRVRRGVFVVAAAPASDRQRIAIACVATGGTASSTTAGRYWAFRRVPIDPRVHVTLLRSSMSRHKRLDGVCVHRCLELPATDVVRCGDGIRVTSPPRTLFDLAAVVDAEALESMIEQAIDRGMFGVATLWGVARRLARRGRAGSTRFVDVLASRSAWRKPSGSDDELTLERLLVSAGMRRPERQFAVRLPDGRTVRPDLVWPSCSWRSRSITSAGTVAGSSRRTTSGATARCACSGGRSTASPIPTSASARRPPSATQGCAPRPELAAARRLIGCGR